MKKSKRQLVIDVDAAKTPQELVKDIYDSGLSYGDISRALGCTHQYVQKMAVGHNNIRYTWWLALFTLRNQCVSNQAKTQA